MNDTIVLSVRLTSTCPHGKPSNTCCGYAQWMRVIHSINRAHQAAHPGAEQYIGAPTSTYEQSGGRWFEEYPEARVILLPGDSTGGYVQAKTPECAEYLRAAVREIVGIEVDDRGQAISRVPGWVG